MDETDANKSWTIDVQRGLAWTIVCVFALLLIAMALRVIVSGAPTDSLELLKQGVNALINIVMMVMGYFFGSSKSSQAKDETASRVAEKLAEKVTTSPGLDAITAAALVAPPAAAVAAPPAAEAAAPAAAEKAVADALHKEDKP